MYYWSKIRLCPVRILNLLFDVAVYSETVYLASPPASRAALRISATGTRNSRSVASTQRPERTVHLSATSAHRHSLGGSTDGRHTSFQGRASSASLFPPRTMQRTRYCGGQAPWWCFRQLSTVPDAYLTVSGLALSASEKSFARTPGLRTAICAKEASFERLYSPATA